MMDESWRMRIGMSSFPRRKSTEESLLNLTRKSFSGESETVDPNDFNDVFGGPPRTILSRNFSGEFPRTTSFYEEIFRYPEPALTPSRSGRNLPAFRIPTKREIGRGIQRGDGFYSDIFGSDNDVRFMSESKSRSNSSSVLSSEDLSPHRPVTGEDPAIYTFASKLRPINVPSRWNSSVGIPAEHCGERAWLPDFPSNSVSYPINQFTESYHADSVNSSCFVFSRQVPSPESISLDPDLFGSMKVSEYNIEEIDSPSGVSSIFHEYADAKGKTHENVMQYQEREADQHDDENDDDDDMMSSYVIEINSDHREGTSEAISIDDAIAWAKEKYQTQCSKEKSSSQGRSEVSGFSSNQVDGHGPTNSLMEEQMKWETEKDKVGTKEAEVLDEEIEILDEKMEILDGKIEIWSIGKEANIRFLLSTLHHILWANSGWCEITILNLIEAHCVKKAYQKARLCLHPDKLQQRGATLPQKYVAEKAFSILQDAWAVFVSQNAFSS